MMLSSLSAAVCPFDLFLNKAGQISMGGNNTLHASRQLCAHWGVSFFRGSPDA